MCAAISLRAEQLSMTEKLTRGGIKATTDPAQAETTRPCVLVAPPTLDYQARAVRHRLLCLAAHPAGTVAALDQLDQLQLDVTTELAGYVERAEPTSYALTTDAGGTVPAYLLTITT